VEARRVRGRWGGKPSRDCGLAAVPIAGLSDIDAYCAELTPLFGHDLGDSPPIAMKQLSALGRYDAFDRLASITAPTLVASAAHDRIALPEFGKELASAIPGAKYVEIEDAGHGVPIHRPDVLNDLLRRHFDGR